jgi:hypothetical protein
MRSILILALVALIDCVEPTPNPAWERQWRPEAYQRAWAAAPERNVADVYNSVARTSVPPLMQPLFSNQPSGTGATRVA